jgi:hypothetical protein
MKSVSPSHRLLLFFLSNLVGKETILKAKVFMRGKKMGWVGPLLVPL